MQRGKAPHLNVLIASLTLGACLETQPGRVLDTNGDTGDTGDREASTPDTSFLDTSTPDTSKPDSSTPVVALPPGGSWLRETIGDCIHVYDILRWSDDRRASWSVDDDNYCYDIEPTVTFEGRADPLEDHVMALRFESEGRVPSELTWTWAVLPTAPIQLHTAAFRRVPGTDRWRRVDVSIMRYANDRSERRLQVDVTLVGYPEVTAMRVAFDVSERFSAGSDARGGAGKLELAAKRIVSADGRVKIAAAGYELDMHPERYRFQQELLAQFDVYTVDLIGDAFFPVLIEVEGDPGSLIMERYDRVWTRQED